MTSISDLQFRDLRKLGTEVLIFTLRLVCAKGTACTIALGTPKRRSQRGGNEGQGERDTESESQRVRGTEEGEGRMGGIKTRYTE